MKGFIITVLVVVAIFITAISQVSNICQSFYDKALEAEGGASGPMRDAFNKIKENEPAQFHAKFAEPFASRLKITQGAFYFAADEMFKTVAEDTRERYLGTLFDKDEGFDTMLYRLARTLEDRQPSVYYDRLLEIREHFPNCVFRDDLDTKIKLMKVRLNIAALNSRFATFC